MSSSFEIKQKTKITVSIYGQSFELTKPTVGQVEELQKYNTSEDKDKPQNEIYDSICGYLSVLGLPVEFSKQMEIDHLVQLINYISGELNFDKKKSEAGQ